MGVSGMQLHYWDKIQDYLYGNSQVVASVTPMIVEEREMRAIQMSVFDRLMMDRIIWLVGPVHDGMSTVVQAQLMWLDQQNKGDITIHVDTPGGSTKSGKSMIDVMNYIVSDISTINTGMAASMGSLLLASGTKGKRYSLPSSKVMIHQVSAGTSGNIQDMRISIEEAEKENNSLFEILGEKCNKSPEEVMRDATRDKWLTAEEAKSYGLIDDIILNKGVK
jgi:ATP-dependent Clp protease protease subunit